MSAVVNELTNINDVRAGAILLPPLPKQPTFSPRIVEPGNAPIAKTLDELRRPSPGNDEELLKHRFLCRGGGLLLVGPTGIGKSSLSMQMMINWALGRSVFGIEPAKPLKSLLIQAENDEGDLSEMRDGVFSGLNLSDSDRESACSRIFIVNENSKVSKAFITDTVKPILDAVKPDILWIDPVLAYLGGEMNSQQEVGRFLRNLLNPVLAEFNCAVVIIHHTNKPYAGNEKRGSVDVAYLGAGSAEWSNWSRAILSLQKTDTTNVFELRAAKRGGRLGWKEPDQTATSYSRLIAYHKEPGTICWVDVDPDTLQGQSPEAKDTDATASVMKHVPPDNPVAKQVLISRCSKDGIGIHRAAKLIDNLVRDGALFIWNKPRKGNKPEVHLARIAQPLDESGKPVFTVVTTAPLTCNDDCVHPEKQSLQHHPFLKGCNDGCTDVRTGCQNEVDLLPVDETKAREDLPPSPPPEVLQSAQPNILHLETQDRYQDFEDALIAVGKLLLKDELHAPNVSARRVAALCSQLRLCWPTPTDIAMQTEGYFQIHEPLVRDGIKVQYHTEHEEGQLKHFLDFHRYQGPPPKYDV